MMRQWKNESGLTLVEVVVATLLLGMGILTAVTVLTTGMKYNNLNRDKAVAIGLAQDKMEEWKFKDLAVVSSDITIPPDAPGVLENNSNAATENYVIYGLTVTGSYTDEGQKLVKISIEVNWRSNSGAVRKVVLETVRPVS
jgi:type II secretory pathway pseudopilin PulG